MEEILHQWVGGLSYYFFGVSTIKGDAGFLPSTVVQSVRIQCLIISNPLIVYNATSTILSGVATIAIKLQSLVMMVDSILLYYSLLFDSGIITMSFQDSGKIFG